MTQNTADASRQRAARLKDVFKDVAPIEITTLVNLDGKSPNEIATLLPKFTAVQQKGENPAFGIQVDPATKRAWSLRSGFSPHLVETVNGIPYKSGIMSLSIATDAGGAWSQKRAPLGAHLEGQAAAFMRKLALKACFLYINGIFPCKNGGLGCWFLLPELLAEGSVLTVYNKSGSRFPPFVGSAD